MRRYHHEVVYRRPVDGGSIACELHSCLFVERRARRFDHAAVARLIEPSSVPGLWRLPDDAQLLALALHLAHHAGGERRLIWLRDFIELGHETAVRGAREIASRHHVGWALEGALGETERILGSPRWEASPRSPARFGLARVQELERPGRLYHLALAWELGPVEGLRYLGSKLDPRRFIR